MSPLYLDHNATTAIDPAVIDEMTRVWRSGPVNASSQHRIGQRARRTLESSLQRIAQSLGSDLRPTGGARLIVTGGGTEANNLAVNGLGEESARLIVSAIEHPSVVRAAEQSKRRGRRVDIIAVDQNGCVELDRLRGMLRETSGETVVSIMSANNETGVLQPIGSIAELCRAAGATLHVDATQTVGKLPIDLKQLGADAVTLTPHKYHGPAGVGMLWLAPGVPIRPLAHGGMQQLGDRPGTEAVALVAGAAVATSLAAQRLAETSAHMQKCRDELETRLRSLADRHDRELVIFGDRTTRLPNTTSMAIAGIDRQRLLLALDFDGIACSSGSACRSGSSGPSDVLTAMGVPTHQLTAAIRLSNGRDTPLESMATVAERIWHHAGRMLPAS